MLRVQLYMEVQNQKPLYFYSVIRNYKMLCDVLPLNHFGFWRLALETDSMFAKRNSLQSNELRSQHVIHTY